MKKIPVFAALFVTFFAASAWIGLSYANDSTASEATQAETATIELAVQNMTCATCPIAVRKSLERVEGTLDVEVDYATKLARVTYDPRRTNVAALTQATTAAGYPSTAVK